MIEVRETEAFKGWMAGLKDSVGKARIAARVRRLALGHIGDVKPVGEGVRELRVFIGPGYRIYFVQRGAVLIVVLCGGDKGSQARDIDKAKAMAREL